MITAPGTTTVKAIWLLCSDSTIAAMSTSSPSGFDMIPRVGHGPVPVRVAGEAVADGDVSRSECAGARGCAVGHGAPSGFTPVGGAATDRARQPTILSSKPVGPLPRSGPAAPGEAPPKPEVKYPPVARSGLLESF
ncbi:hypothetical protein GCM10010519_20580 [Streptomyces lactacystinicus]